jgi:Tol biopolymer transport system component
VNERVSIATDGTEGNSPSQFPAISADGRYVAFQSYASSLVPGDNNGMTDIFVRDRQDDTLTRVSVASDGTEGNHHSQQPAISADGRYVTFWSRASNLVPGDTNGRDDVFVHDLQTGTTERVSVAADGTQASSESYDPAISADGRYVAFYSFAPLVPGDTNGDRDIFVRDRQAGTTEQVSTAPAGTQANGANLEPSLSPDGRFVVFWSWASNLVTGDTNGAGDVFLRDRQTNTTERISVATDGTQADAGSVNATVSADGRYVAFRSLASNLAPGDTNGFVDVFVRDRQTNTTTRVSVAADGSQANNTSFDPTISADGRYVAFTGEATNLVPGDTNNAYDVFLSNLSSGALERVNLTESGTQTSRGQGPAITADGRYVAFFSNASGLVPGDTNSTDDVFVRDLADVTAPALTLPGSVTAEATGPDGAAVTYAVSASDDTDPDPVVDCTPASGAGFGRGTTTVSCTATDDTGNTATGSFTVTVADTTAPTVALTGPSEGSTVSGQVDLTATAADAVGVRDVRFRVDGADLGAEDTTAPYATAWDTTDLANGTHELTAVAIDGAGLQTTSAPVTVTVENDTNAPTTTATTSTAQNTAGWHNTDVTVTLSASDGVDGSGVREISYTLDDAEPVRQPGDEATVHLEADGEHEISYFATDNVGNTEEARSQVVRIDTTAPQVSCDQPSEAWSDHDVTLGCTATDTGSGLAEDDDADFALSTTVPDGTEDADATTGSRVVADQAGNTTAVGPIGGNHVDRKPPPAPTTPDLADASDTGLSATDDVTADTTPTLIGSASPDAATVTLLVDGVETTPVQITAGGTYAFTIGDLTVGVHAITATSADAVGNVSPASAELTIEVVGGTACNAATNSIIGTKRANTLVGQSLVDLILGLGGADKLSGGGNADCISGGRGSDTLRGGKGSDEITGGAGRDTIRGDAGDDIINAVDGTQDRVYCDAGSGDRATVDRIDTVVGCERVTRKRP